MQLPAPPPRPRAVHAEKCQNTRRRARREPGAACQHSLVLHVSQLAVCALYAYPLSAHHTHVARTTHTHPPQWLVFVKIQSTLHPLSPRPFLTTSPTLLLPACPYALTGELLAE